MESKDLKQYLTMLGIVTKDTARLFVVISVTKKFLEKNNIFIKLRKNHNNRKRMLEVVKSQTL
jgi:hypothetical protein